MITVKVRLSMEDGIAKLRRGLILGRDPKVVVRETWTRDLLASETLAVEITPGISTRAAATRPRHRLWTMPLTDAIDFAGCRARRSTPHAGGSSRRGTTSVCLAAAPHERFAPYIGERPPAAICVLPRADGADFLGEDPQHARRRLASPRRPSSSWRASRERRREHRSLVGVELESV